MKARKDKLRTLERTISEKTLNNLQVRAQLEDIQPLSFQCSYHIYCYRQTLN